MDEIKEKRQKYIFHVPHGICSLKCVFCNREEKVPIQKIEEEINTELKTFEEYNQKYSFELLVLSGSDLLEYPHLFELIDKIKSISNNKNMKIGFLTHGIDLTVESCKKLIQKNVNILGFPIYGPTEEIHDSIVNYPGAFSKITQLLYELNKTPEFIQKNNSITIIINFLLLKQNQDHVSKMINLLKYFDNLILKFSVALPSHSTKDVIWNKRLRDCYPSLESFQSELRKAIILAYLEKINIEIRNIPKCIFYKSFYDLNFKTYYNYSHSSPSEIYFLEEKNNWRQNTELNVFQTYKTEKCKECLFFESCSGIYPIYYQLNLFEPRPIKS